MAISSVRALTDRGPNADVDEQPRKDSTISVRKRRAANILNRREWDRTTDHHHVKVVLYH